MLTMVSATAFTQKNIVKAGLIASGGINTGIQYERSLGQSFSILGQAGYAYIADAYFGGSSHGLGVYLEGRFYFSRNRDPMEGWHGGIYGNFMDTKNDNDFSSYTQKNVSGGLVGGYQWIFQSQIALDTLLGFGYLNKDAGFSDEGSLYPLIGLNLGYSF